MVRPRPGVRGPDRLRPGPRVPLPRGRRPTDVLHGLRRGAPRRASMSESARRGIPFGGIPRTEPRRDQLMRALAFERLGCLRLVDPYHLDPSTLRESIDATLRAPGKTPGPVALPWDGAARAAAELLRLAEAPARPAASVRA